MQSSVWIALRTMIMVACLVVVPMIALLGNASWPEVVGSLLARLKQEDDLLRQEAISPGSNLASAEATFSTPLDRLKPPAPLADGAGDRPGSPLFSVRDKAESSGTAEASEYFPAIPPDLSSGHGNLASGRLRPPPALFWSAENAASNPGEIQAAASTAGNSPAAGAMPAGYLDYQKEVVPPSADPLEAIEERLKALGAVRYRLESWGVGGRLFRFQCKMALASNPNYVRFFEATGRDPASTMQEVLDQVEAWQKASRSAGGLAR